MKFRTITTFLLAFTLVFGAGLATASPASADSSFNGLMNSKGASFRSISNSFAPGYQSQNRYQNQNLIFGYNEEAIQALIERLQEMIRLLQTRLDETTQSDTSDVSVTTRSAVDITDDGATLRGRLYLQGEDEADVYFAYGESRTDLDEETDKMTLDDNDSMYFEDEITGLDDNTVYYFRAVAEDVNGDEDYGTIYSFRTDTTEDELDLPYLQTKEASNVTEDEAELEGYVDMNDYDNGKVFFVYGEDESTIEDIADDYDTYADIDEDGDNLQKVSVDSDLNGTTTYQETVSGLDPDTDIYYSVCVEFDDENDDAMLMCGDVETFQTENN